ncbi:MAG: NosD domain-containing protein [Planctomycetota bacterium JB042]
MTRSNALLALSTAALLTSSAAAADRLVPSQYPTIQAAVDAALPGDKVRIADGVYDEGVMVVGKHDLAIKGDDDVFVRMIWVDGSTQVSVKEITYFEANDYQLIVTGSNGVDVRFSTFQNGPAGVGAFYSQDVNVRDSDFMALSNGVYFEGCQQSRIAAMFVGTEVAAIVTGGSGNVIEDCPFKDAGAVFVESAPFTTIRSNSFKQTRLHVDASSGVLVEGNNFKKAPHDAIYLNGVFDATIQGNKVKKSAVNGLRIDAGGGNLVFANKIAKAGVSGIQLFSAGNSLQQNKVKKSAQLDLVDHTGGQNFYAFNKIKTSNL